VKDKNIRKYLKRITKACGILLLLFIVYELFFTEFPSRGSRLKSKKTEVRLHLDVVFRGQQAIYSKHGIYVPLSCLERTGWVIQFKPQHYRTMFLNEPSTKLKKLLKKHGFADCMNTPPLNINDKVKKQIDEIKKLNRFIGISDDGQKYTVVTFGDAFNGKIVDAWLIDQNKKREHIIDGGGGYWR